MSHLKIYVLPTLRNKLSFHAKFLKPTNKLELGALFMSYCIRKWRYQLSDFFGSYWHEYGSRFNSVYRFGNRITTRRAEDEYFWKSIPSKSTSIEIVYPSSLHELQIREQLREWLSTNQRFQNQLVFLALLLPANLFIAKVMGVFVANFVFTYHIFRLNAAFRAVYGSKRFLTLYNTERVKFVNSQELEDQIQAISKDVGKEVNWKYQPRQDLHDLVIERLSKECKLPELQQSFRRSRMRHFVHQ